MDSWVANPPYLRLSPLQGQHGKKLTLKISFNYSINMVDVTPSSTALSGRPAKAGQKSFPSTTQQMLTEEALQIQ
jgi:hypothetical protein